jgi:hypothetical protein
MYRYVLEKKEIKNFPRGSELTVYYNSKLTSKNANPF